MSPARQHRERAALAAATPSTTVDPTDEGGQTTAATAEAFAAAAVDNPASPARAHRLQFAAIIAAGATADGVEGIASLDPHVAQVVLRLTHDLRRLKDIKSIQLKIAAKREMVPAYDDWIASLLQATESTGEAAADEVLPTIMIWAIDIGDWDYALRLADHVVAHDLPLPGRYQRDAATLIVEEIATAALDLQNRREAFRLDVLEHVEALTADHDMHDEVRAKLKKAIGVELTRAADALDAKSPEFRAAAERALIPLRRAQELNDRAGAKDRIKRLEKALAVSPPAGGEQGAAPATGGEQPDPTSTDTEQADAPAADGEQPGTPPTDTEQAGDPPAA